MNRYQTVRSRWRPAWDKRNDYNRLNASLKVTIEGAEKLATKADEVLRSDLLSGNGKIDAMRQFSAKEIVPNLRRAGHEIDRMQGEIAEKRRALSTPKPDPADVAGAILRMDLRNWLRTLEPGARIAVLAQDDTDLSVLQAAFEVPADMLGIPLVNRAELEQRIIVAKHPDKLAAIEEDVEATALVNSALTMALMELQASVSFDTERNFAAWFDAASAEVDREYGRAARMAAVPREGRPIGDIVNDIFDAGFADDDSQAEAA